MLRAVARTATTSGRPMTEDELIESVRSPGYTPRRAQIAPLLDLLARADDALATCIERSLARLGPPILEAVRERWPQAEERARVRLCRLVGRVALAHPEAEAASTLLREALIDDGPRARRAAIIALGKLRHAWIEEQLLAAWASEPLIEQRRALAAALGKVGGDASLSTLEGTTTDDDELSRLLDEARLKLERTLGRTRPSRIVIDRAPGSPLPAALRCRAGLEPILCDEIPPALAPRVAGPGIVEATLAGPLRTVLDLRTALSVGFPLPAALSPDPAADGAVVARTLAAPGALAILRAFSEGPIRLRLEWAGAGHRRAASWRCARELARGCPELINDPTASTWQVVIAEAGRGGTRSLGIELLPRATDARFAYRRRDVPAASHPTVAAALARVAGVRVEDVVWDPFVGSAGELVERGLLGAYAELHGSDVEEDALAAARVNLSAAGLVRWTLACGDARTHVPPRPPTLIITNPPLGRRVLRRAEVGPLLERCLERFAALLAPGGRLVWISPSGARSVDAAEAAGLQTKRRQVVDMGGFNAELQVFDKPAAHAGRRGRC
jgi:hypothetical protein